MIYSILYEIVNKHKLVISVIFDKMHREMDRTCDSVYDYIDIEVIIGG